MSEMLGNQYFLARNYELATDEYEKSLVKTPNNLFIRKKLILCYIKTGNLDNALKNLIAVLIKDPNIIFSTKTEIDDCPCKELINKIDTVNNEEFTKEKKILALGILWLYCDVKKALEMFEKISEESKYHFEINKITKLIHFIK